MQQNNHPSHSAYLAIILEYFQQYEYTRSPQILKNLMKKNRQVLQNIIEESQVNKETNSAQKSLRKNSYDGFSTLKNEEEEKEKKENFRLQKEYQYELQLSKGNNVRVSQQRQKLRKKQMDNTLMSLNQRIGKLRQQNDDMCKKLQKQRFYKEWLLMSKEVEGAKNLNVKLKRQFEKKKKQLLQLPKNA